MIALIRYEVSATLRAHGRVCAVELLAGDVTPATWRLLAAECESLSAHRSGTYVRRAVAETCERMARGDVAGAVERMARECGMTAEEWAAETRREMGVRS